MKDLLAEIVEYVAQDEADGAIDGTVRETATAEATGAIVGAIAESAPSEAAGAILGAIAETAIDVVAEFAPGMSAFTMIRIGRRILRGERRPWDRRRFVIAAARFFISRSSTMWYSTAY